MIFDKEYHDNWQAGVIGRDGKAEYRNFKVGHYKYPDRVEFVAYLLPRIILAFVIGTIIGTVWSWQ